MCCSVKISFRYCGHTGEIRFQASWNWDGKRTIMEEVGWVARMTGVKNGRQMPLQEFGNSQNHSIYGAWSRGTRQSVMPCVQIRIYSKDNRKPVIESKGRGSCTQTGNSLKITQVAKLEDSLGEIQADCWLIGFQMWEILWYVDIKKCLKGEAWSQATSCFTCAMC